MVPLEEGHRFLREQHPPLPQSSFTTEQWIEWSEQFRRSQADERQKRPQRNFTFCRQFHYGWTGDMIRGFDPCPHCSGGFIFFDETTKDDGGSR